MDLKGGLATGFVTFVSHGGKLWQCDKEETVDIASTLRKQSQMPMLVRLCCSFCLYSLGSQFTLRWVFPSALQPPYILSQRVVSWAVLNPVRLTIKVNFSQGNLESASCQGKRQQNPVTHSTVAFLH